MFSLGVDWETAFLNISSEYFWISRPGWWWDVTNSSLDSTTQISQGSGSINKNSQQVFMPFLQWSINEGISVLLFWGNRRGDEKRSEQVHKLQMEMMRYSNFSTFFTRNIQLDKDGTKREIINNNQLWQGRGEIIVLCLSTRYNGR